MTSDDVQNQRSDPGQDRAAGPPRVLIVDDNQEFAGFLASALDSMEGVECVGVAGSAAEGFRQLAELLPSVVVMDLMMPGVDGLAATHELRRLSPGTAVAVLSAHSQPEWMARAEDAGASAYVSKGGSLTEMIGVLAAARPGPMIVAPSLQQAWSAWKQSVAASTGADRHAAPALHRPGKKVSRQASRATPSPKRSGAGGRLWERLSTRSG